MSSINEQWKAREMIVNCPQCGAETSTGVYCQTCTDLLQAELEASEVLDFAMQWCIDHFKVKTGLQIRVKAWLAEMPDEDVEEYKVKVFVPEAADEVSLSIGEGAGDFYVIQVQY